jgi:hypothetical protein
MATKETRINDKQRAFAELVAAGRVSASEAVRQVYGAGSSTKSDSVRAAQLMKLDHVKDYIELMRKELRERRKSESAARGDKALLASAQRAAVTLETIADELDEAWLLAKELGQPATMVAASTAKAKLFGLMAEKLRVEKVRYVISADAGISSVDEGDADAWAEMHFGDQD